MNNNDNINNNHYNNDNDINIDHINDTEALAGLLGGWLLDAAAARFPDHGPIIYIYIYIYI